MRDFEAAVYFNDFENQSAPLNEWSDRARTISPVGSRGMLGEFSSNSTQLTLANLPAHTEVFVSFDLFINKTWDGNGDGCCGPDRWSISIENTPLSFQTTFINAFCDFRTQAFPDAFPGGRNPGGTGAVETYSFLGFSYQGQPVGGSGYHLEYVVPHTTSSLAATFGASGLQGASDESWTLDNVRVCLARPETGIGGSIVFIDLNANGRRDDSEPFTTSDQYGQYALTSLPSGQWRIVVEGGTGWTPVAPVSGGHAIALTSGQFVGNVDFGLKAKAPGEENQLSFASTPGRDGEVGQTYRYRPSVLQTAASVLSFDLISHPQGMQVDSQIGVLVWEPTLLQIGVHDVILRVQDGNGGVALQSFQIAVATPDSGPVITTLPPGPATVAKPYRYVVRAQDAEGEALSFSLSAGAPAGMTLNPQPSTLNYSVLEWTPTLAQLGTGNHVEIVVRDPGGAEARQAFDLEVVVSAQNRAPVFTSTPRSKTRIDLPYAYLVKATDADGDPLAFVIVASPLGMLFDNSQPSTPNSQLIRWTPTPQNLGSHAVTIRATDGRGGTTEQTFTLTVASSLENEPPQIVSNPLLNATAGQPYVYDLRATDPDGDDVTWRLVSGPVGVSLDRATGALRWTPTLDQLGSNTITVEAADTVQATATQTWIVDVGCINRPPRITSTPPVVAQTGDLYLYAPCATDPDGDKLAWTLTANPTGMTIDAATGLIRWTPLATQTGATLVTLRVSDLRGGTDTQTYTLTATDVRANKPPVIVSTPLRGATAQRPYSYAVRATDPDGDTLILSLLAAPAGATITTTASVKGQVDGLVSWTPTAAQSGPFEFIVVAKDPANASAAQRFFVTVRANAPPIITSIPPSSAVPTIASHYDVLATDADGDALTYALTTAPIGMTIDSLGRIVWTPTLAQVGSHNVSVIVNDGYGGSATQSYSIAVGADTVAPTVELVVGYNLVDGQGNKYSTSVPVPRSL